MVPLPTLASLDPGSTGNYLCGPPLPSASHSQPPWLPRDLSAAQLSPAGLGPGSSKRKPEHLLGGRTASWVPAPRREGPPGSTFEPPGELSLHKPPPGRLGLSRYSAGWAPCRDGWMQGNSHQRHQVLGRTQVQIS